MSTMPDNSERPLVRVTRRYRFSSSHRLHTPALSDERNRAVYGKCNNPYGHGHDYVMDVTIRGQLDPRLGRLIPIAQLDLFIRSTIVDAFDHRNLNLDVPEFATLVPTTENLAEVAAQRLAAAWPLAFPGSAAIPEKVRIWETKNNIFEVFIGGAGPASRDTAAAAPESRLLKETR
jgi:6-pyruvoyltetrahydropterin/6-carboxytetrahydropterin synthase